MTSKRAVIAILACMMILGCSSPKESRTTETVLTTTLKEQLNNTEKYCSSDSDCACGVHRTTGECFYGNKDYVDAMKQCPDFCTGIAAQFAIICVNNLCTQVKSQVGQGTPATVPAEPAAVTVTIKDFAFQPNEIRIKTGTIVTWINEDSAPHKVASDPHPAHTDLPGLVSGNLAQGQSYSFTFSTPGTFGYHCHLHPSMTGRVIVEV
ncbi:MAG: cupredoxin family copper-binding protein [Candidatus Altiarchaeota archaeon]|nr:cupredoxin family copper-binding protein [Candidatus Altiarchaeota archaeon]